MVHRGRTRGGGGGVLASLACLLLTACVKQLEVGITEYPLRSVTETDALAVEVRRDLDGRRNRFELKTGDTAPPEGWETTFRFLHVSDVQLRDAGIKYINEKRSAFIDKIISSTERVDDLDYNDESTFLALVGAVNALEDKPRFLLHTGDAIDAGTMGELTLFLMIGNHLNVPWFNAVGNHDVLLFGNFTQNWVMLGRPQGRGNLLMDSRSMFTRLHGPNDVDPVAGELTGHRDTEFPDAQALGPEVAEGLRSCYHGFDRSERSSEMNCDAPISPYYSLLVSDDPPLRLLVLDTTLPDAQILALGRREVPGIGSCGHLFEEQTQWLLRELAAARRARERVIVAGHHPMTSGGGCGDLLASVNGRTDERLVDLLGVQAEVVAYLGGHTHRASIRTHETPRGPLHEVIAPSLHVFPQVGLQVSVVRRSGSEHGFYVEPVAGRVTEGPLRERLERACAGAREESRSSGECWQDDPDVRRLLPWR